MLLWRGLKGGGMKETNNVTRGLAAQEIQVYTSNI